MQQSSRYRTGHQPGELPGVAREGCAVVLAGRRQATLDAVATELAAVGATTLVKTCDVSREADVDALFHAVQQRFGKVDILVNNAGAFDGGPLDEVTLKAWNNVIGACLTGTFLCSRTAFRMMKSQRSGRILNIGSFPLSASRVKMPRRMPRQNSASGV